MPGRGPQRTPSIAVVGSMNIDLVTYASRLPGPGETVMGERFAQGFGGKGANQAVMARLLGADVAMIGALGQDAYAEMTLDNLAGYGVDTRHVARVAGSSGVAPIWVEPDGTNRIIVVAGANAGVAPEAAAIAVEGLPALDVVIGQFEVPQGATAAAFAAGRARAATTILNPAPAGPILDGLLAVTDWLVANETEFAYLFRADPADDAGLAVVAERITTRLVVTLGSRGAALVGEDGHLERASAPSVDAVDTTGAGDAFVGAFAYGLAAGLAGRDAVRLGIACASDSVHRPGTQSSFPDPGRAAELLAEVRAIRERP